MAQFLFTTREYVRKMAENDYSQFAGIKKGNAYWGWLTTTHYQVEDSDGTHIIQDRNFQIKGENFPAEDFSSLTYDETKLWDEIEYDRAEEEHLRKYSRE